MMHRRLLLAAALPLATPAVAQFGSGRPLRLIVPNPPGGQSDTIARLYGEAIQAQAGQPVVVENRSGANGLIAMDAVAKAAPDGLTTGLFSITLFTTLPAMMPRMPLDVDRDLTAITSVVTSTVLCCVTEQRARERGWTDFRAMIEWARRPGRRAIAYPLDATTVPEADLRAALADVGLPHLADRLDEEDAWDRRLSGGEQQRLAAARALLVRPDFLFLDEATASLDPAGETAIYTLLRERLPHTAFLSIAHREAVARFHNRRLRVQDRALVAQ
ncbi:ATP-binding cassette domain-containing protein [Leptolyngbya sp. 15MV]|nr:ATP-binding cassette domain-containing protein [Leptolyngbya sp. 15MV]